ncbi:MAG: hypothetical protein CSB19_00135 [Clostridiales bacterium]|nr:MAG: hypothetical protein CSB19_00135 [Clostridiales bacterium]
MIDSDRLVIRAATESDIAMIMALEQHPANSNYVWQGTVQQHRAEIADDDYFLWVFQLKDGARAVGYALSKIDRKSDVFELRRIVIDEKGQGYGEEALRAIIAHAFEVLNVNRFWLDVYPDNHVAIKLYQKLNMQRDGVLRQSYKSPTGYRDQIIYSLLKSEYFAD